MRCVTVKQNREHKFVALFFEQMLKLFDSCKQCYNTQPKVISKDTENKFGCSILIENLLP